VSRYCWKNIRKKLCTGIHSFKDGQEKKNRTAQHDILDTAQQTKVDTADMFLGFLSRLIYSQPSWHQQQTASSSSNIKSSSGLRYSLFCVYRKMMRKKKKSFRNCHPFESISASLLVGYAANWRRRRRRLCRVLYYHFCSCCTATILI
jgi:hypothetical protein